MNALRKSEDGSLSLGAPPDLELTYWRTSTGREVDFILDDRQVAIKVRASVRVDEAHLKDLTALADDGPVGRPIVVSMESQRRELRDGHGPVLLMSWKELLSELWTGDPVRGQE